MTDAEGKKPGFFARLKAGLARSTRSSMLAVRWCWPAFWSGRLMN